MDFRELHKAVFEGGTAMVAEFAKKAMDAQVPIKDILDRAYIPDVCSGREVQVQRGIHP